MRLFVVCSGLGHVHRGFEAVARTCFDELVDEPGVDAWLINAAGAPHGRERLAPALRRGHAPARALGRMIGRDDYRAECLTYAVSLVPQLALHRPDVVFFSDWPLARPLGMLRSASRLRYKLLLSNGAPGPPPYHPAIDHVQQPTPDLLRLALGAGEPPARHTLLPHGLRLSADYFAPSADERAQLRARLRLPADRRVLLSVAALNNWSKRLSYLIDEVASLPAPERPFLALVGQRDHETPDVVRAAESALGPGGYSVQSARPAELRDWYRAADVFALASTTEGFGLVLLEAMAEGLPCICHDYGTPRFVLGDHGWFGDLRARGTIAGLLRAIGDDELADEARRRRHAWVYENFSWDVLRPRYVEMLERCAEA